MVELSARFVLTSYSNTTEFENPFGYRGLNLGLVPPYYFFLKARYL